jgi:hypothetical protein
MLATGTPLKPDEPLTPVFPLTQQRQRTASNACCE